MDAVAIFASGVADPARGWAGPVALLIAGGVCWAIRWGDAYIRDRWGAGSAPSPTGGAAPDPYETPQAGAVSSHVPRDTTPIETVPAPWWGIPVRLPDGSIAKAFTQAKHIARTGDSLPQEYGDDPGDVDVPDDAIDIGLGEPGEVQPDEVRPDDGAEPDEVRELPVMADYIAHCLAKNVRKPAIVAVLCEHYGRGRASAYRDIRDVEKTLRRRATGGSG